MQQIIPLFAILILFACNGPEAKVESEREKMTTSSSAQTDESSELLTGTWYAKEILIDGHPDPDNFPVNNDELTLNADGSVISIDRSFDLEDRGTWTQVDESSFSISSQEGTVSFDILEIGANKLSTQMRSDEIDMVINYSKTK